MLPRFAAPGRLKSGTTLLALRATPSFHDWQSTSSLWKNGENPAFFSFSIFFSFRVTEKKMEMKKEKEARKWGAIDFSTGC